MSNFTLDFSRFKDKSEKTLTTIVKKSAMGLFTDIVKGTPVDTGRASLSHYIDINKFSDKVAPENATASKNDAIQAKTSEFIAKTNEYKLGDQITLTNNVPYIWELEYGKSRQAPSGFTRINIQRWNKILTKTANEEKK